MCWVLLTFSYRYLGFLYLLQILGVQILGVGFITFSCRYLGFIMLFSFMIWASD